MSEVAHRVCRLRDGEESPCLVEEVVKLHEWYDNCRGRTVGRVNIINKNECQCLFQLFSYVGKR